MSLYDDNDGGGIGPGRIVMRALLVAGLGWYSWYYLTASMMALGDRPGFMHYLHLVFHEFGHVALLWAPRLVCVLGGTIGQLAFPLAAMVIFLVQNRSGYDAAICGWWLGQSLVDVAPYIYDARMLQLPLLGGGTGHEIEGHDWEYILGQLDLLTKELVIGEGVLLAGRIVMVASLLWAAAVMAINLAQWLGRERAGRAQA